MDETKSLIPRSSTRKKIPNFQPPPHPRHLEMLLVTTKTGRKVDFLSLIFSFLLVLHFLILSKSETIEQTEMTLGLEVTGTMLLLIDLTIRTYASGRVLFLFEYIPLLTIANCGMVFGGLVSNLSEPSTDSPYFDELGFLLPLRWVLLHAMTVRVLSAQHNAIIPLSPLTRAVAVFYMDIMFAVLTAATAIFYIELVDQSKETLTFFNCFFFVSVIIGTIGYVDNLVPDNATARLVILAVIVLGALYIPRKIAELIELMNDIPSEKRVVRSGSKRRVLLVADVSRSSRCDILSLMLHEDNWDHSMRTHITVLTDNKPSPQFTMQLSDPFFKSRVNVVRSSAFSSRHSQLMDIDCAVVLAQPAQGKELRQANTLISVVNVRRQAPSATIFAELSDGNDSSVLTSAGATHCIRTTKAKMEVFAVACQCPGFTTLLRGLFTTWKWNEEGHAHPLDDLPDWVTQFSHGIDQDIYKAELEVRGTNVTFGALVLHVLSEVGAVLLGVMDEEEIDLVPALGTVLKGKVVAVVVAQNDQHASAVSKLSPVGDVTPMEQGSPPPPPVQFEIALAQTGSTGVCDRIDNAENHVLVCLASDHWINGVDLLLAKLERFDVVVLTPVEPPQSIVTQRGSVRFVVGKCFEIYDLERVCCNKVSCVVVLQDAAINEEDADSMTILAHQVITRVAPPTAHILCEITELSTSQYLDSTENLPLDLLVSASYHSLARGRVFSPVLFNHILAKGIYVPEIVRILEAFLDLGSNSVGISHRELPQSLVGRSWGDLFDHFVVQDKGVLPLALYCGENTRSNTVSFVWIAPPVETELFASDKVFCLTSDN